MPGPAPDPRPAPLMIVVMGIAGCGKSTVASEIVRAMGPGAVLIDADDHHPPASVEKMSRGEPLTDADRRPWLDSLGAAMRAHALRRENSVTACSALRRAYRERLLGAARSADADGAAPEARAVVLHLGIRPSEAFARVSRRAAGGGHFMPAVLVESQFKTLEPPDRAEARELGYILVEADATASPERLARAALEAALRPDAGPSENA